MAKTYTVELTAEQMKQLGLRIDPFERVDEGEEYYRINCIGNVEKLSEIFWGCDDAAYEKANYCTDRKILEQRVLHETLHRLLWRFSMRNGGDELEWGSGKSAKWRICPISTHDWIADWNYSMGVGTVYFASEELAEQAIEEIVKPFIAEHPEFEVGGCCL